ncbi:unnamed protein product [Litomosoides sigmodontis]|uniref:Uncharacterized protein n=1 Tax=Litomosoides sigmodontis TaxID=42156 RepID=A0A3P6TNB9_LITSI|nr:unnamed protein product [Litomosoides sigmodontis]
MLMQICPEMLKRKRSILQMSEDELEALIKVISPGRVSQNHSKSDLQEIAILWVLENGLRVSHEFTVDGSYGVVVADGNECRQLLLREVSAVE